MDKIADKIKNIPQLKANEFYWFNEKVLDVNVGLILGESAKYKGILYISLNPDKTNQIYKILGKYFEDDYPHTLPGAGLTRYLLFKNRQSLIKTYTELLEKKYIKKKKETPRKTRYVVHKELYVCKKTTAAETPYGYISFNTKEEAEAYALKKIKTLEKDVKKYSKIARELKLILSDRKNKIFSYELYGKKIYLSELQAKPTTIKEGEILFKVERRYTPNTCVDIGEVDKKYEAFVKNFITPNIALLSDGTLFNEQECGCTYPFLFKKDDYNVVTNALKLLNVNGLLAKINSIEYKLECAAKYIKEYKPFKTKEPQTSALGINYNKKTLNEINNLINSNFEWI